MAIHHNGDGVALLYAAADEGSDGLAVAGIRATLLERIGLMESIAVGMTGRREVQNAEDHDSRDAHRCPLRSSLPTF